MKQAVKISAVDEELQWFEALSEQLERSHDTIRQYQLKETKYKRVLKRALSMLDQMKISERKTAGVALSQKFEIRVLRLRQELLLEQIHYQKKKPKYNIKRIAYHW